MESKRSLILGWVTQGVINKEQITKALKVAGILPEGKDWRLFIENLFLWLGGLALSFSVLFFIAYNWNEMGRFAKFALVESLIILNLIFYWKLDIDKVTAKVSITSATILLGVLLALYGQTYQTGADPWQLFANWALLMLPWAVVAHFAPLWLIWVALLNLAFMLYFHARGSLFWFMFSSPEHISWVLFIFNSTVWVIWELVQKQFEWLSERWPIWLIALVSGSSITFLMLLSILDYDSSASAAAISLYFIWAGAVYYVYYKLVADLFMLASLCLSAIVVVTSFFARHLLNHGDMIGGFFVLTLLVIGMAAGSAKWLKSVQKEMSL